MEASWPFEMVARSGMALGVVGTLRFLLFSLTFGLVSTFVSRTRERWPIRSPWLPPRIIECKVHARLTR